MSIKVSVCIPVYGVEKYIEKCARSLFEQTMRDDIEFIFVNDCTKDRSIEILEQVLAEYPHRKEQTKIIQHKQNGGLVAARNTGLLHASGEYIIHCDSDDWPELDMYEKMYHAAKEADADMVYCDYIRDYENGKSETCHNPTVTDPDDHITAIASTAMFGAVWYRMYKAEIALKDYSEYCKDHIVISEDSLRNSCMLLNCKKIIHLQQTLYHYRIRQTSMLHTPSKHYRECVYQAVQMLSKVMRTDAQQKALASRKRWALVITLGTGQLTAKEWHATWKDVKWGVWTDRNLKFKSKLIFCIACINYTLASYLYRKLKNIK